MNSEFQFIQHIKEKYSLRKVGDDCAVFPKDEQFDNLITADMLIEDIDFRLSFADPRSIGHKSLAVSLSDIAAMGGTPKYAMLSIGIPEKLWSGSFLDEFYIGWHKLARKFDVELVGGDISRSPDKVVIDSVVIGEVPKDKAVLRSGAKAGDAIFVSGTLGAAAAGLKILESGNTQDLSENAKGLIDQQLRPQPQVVLAKHLYYLGLVTSMIDLSDGISCDLAHICSSSGVGAKIEIENLPIHPGLDEYFESEDSILQYALHGGEDFELLFTVSEDSASSLSELAVTRIGTATINAGRIEITKSGNTTLLEPEGFRHF
ncbi:MAG: thiamine-phosphate kinase [Pyrinomonadaceae bacterium]